VKSFPGESTAENIVSLLFALLYPASGIVRGLDAIFRHAVFTKHELQRAAQVGALCMFVRSNLWTPAEASLVMDCNLSHTGKRLLSRVYLRFRWDPVRCNRAASGPGTSGSGCHGAKWRYRAEWLESN
jgi:hypothetical protein